MKTAFRWLWRAIRGVLLALAAVVLFLEEWGWRPLTAWAARIGRWPPFARVEARIRQASPRTALLLFLAPAVLLFPIKVLALWLVKSGHAGLGILLIITLKIVSTAFLGRLFIITEPQLVTFAWFARALGWWRATKLRVRQAVVDSSGWQGVLKLRRRTALWVRRFARRHSRGVH